MFIITYIIGFIITLFLFIKFGKKLGINYDVEKTYVNYDDWDSNAQAYTCFSLFWPIVLPILTIFGLGAGLIRLVAYLIIKYGN
jgi:hypothetical protein